MLARITALVLCTLLASQVTAQEPCPPGPKQLVIHHAGSLNASFKAVENLFTQRTGICVVDVPGGSVSGARQVTTGRQPADILASADFEVIEKLVKPGKYADFTIRFAEGAMVLAYRTSSKSAATIAAGDVLASDWYTQLSQPGVAISGSHPFLDPGGYRADLIFQLAEAHYGVPGLYNTLLTRYSIGKPSDALGKTFDYQFTYEHSAQATAKADTAGTYHFVKLPDEVSLGASAMGKSYARRSITIPGLEAGTTVRIPASRVTWGLTVLKAAPHRDNAIAFLELLFGSEGVALQAATGPSPISPPLASPQDHARLSAALRKIVKAQSATP